MSIFMKATLKVKTFQSTEFLEALEQHLVPLMEEQGWRLHGTFVQRFGSMQPTVVVDLWEMEDMAHVERVLKDTSYRSDPRYQAACRYLSRPFWRNSLNSCNSRWEV